MNEKRWKPNANNNIESFLLRVTIVRFNEIDKIGLTSLNKPFLVEKYKSLWRGSEYILAILML